MIERNYIILRKIFFWFFVFVFFISSYIFIFYSMGYQFDFKKKKFIKTGILTIKSDPWFADIIVDSKKIRKKTPCVIRDLFPGEYELITQKEGYYPYKIDVEVIPNLVKNIDVTLIPQQRNIERIEIYGEIFKVFPIHNFLTTSYLLFTESGIYIVDKKLKIEKVLHKQKLLDKSKISSLQGMVYNDKYFVCWNQMEVWLINRERSKKDIGSNFTLIYRAQDKINNILWAFQNKYLLIQDGLKIMMLDIEEPKFNLEILELKSTSADIYCFEPCEDLVIRDYDTYQKRFSLYKISLKNVKEK